MWEWRPRFFFEDVAHRKVVERHAERSDNPKSAPTCREFELVAWFFFDGVFYINGAAFAVDGRIDTEVFLVEIAKVDNFALRTDDVGTAKPVAWPGTQFAPNNVFVCAVVAFDDNAVNGS